MHARQPEIHPAELTRPFHEIPTSEPARGKPRPASDAGTRLVINRGPSAGSSFPITQTRTTLGRYRDCDIVLDDVTVSRYHAELRRDGDRYTITDSGSLNGLYVNQRPADHDDLADGDEIWIGKFRLTFYTRG
jgi:pSer/pThr/pTyr-binding forkhead associated (FHA) protein